MALTTNPKVWKIMAVLFFLLTALVLLFFYFENIFIPIAIGGVLIVLTERLIEDYGRNIGRYRVTGWRGRIYGYGLVAFWIFAVTFLLVNSIDDLGGAFSEIRFDAQAIQAYLLRYREFIPEFLGSQVVSDEAIQGALSYAISLFTRFLQQVSVFAGNSVLIVPLMFFMYFRRRGDIAEHMRNAIPDTFKDAALKGAREVNRELRGFLTAKIIQSMVVGAVCTLGFFVAGVKGWLVLGILAGILNIIPYLGPVMGAIPPLLVTLLANDAAGVTIVLIAVSVAQLVDNLYLTPFMLSSRIKIDPLVTIVLILVGARLFGITGMLFSIPMYLVYKIVLREAYVQLVSLCDRKPAS